MFHFFNSTDDLTRDIEAFSKHHVPFRVNHKLITFRSPWGGIKIISLAELMITLCLSLEHYKEFPPLPKTQGQIKTYTRTHQFKYHNKKIGHSSSRSYPSRNYPSSRSNPPFFTHTSWLIPVERESQKTNFAKLRNQRLKIHIKPNIS